MNHEQSAVTVRARRDDDVARLVDILERVAVEGYPPHRPSAIATMIASRHELASYVAELDGEVVGHVALHDYSARSVMETAARALNEPADHLAGIARLFVDPASRRTGAGTHLLTEATQCAHALQRRPVLDVWEQLPNAIRLYEASGWIRVGSTEIVFGSSCTDQCVHGGNSIVSLVYAGPARSG